MKRSNAGGILSYFLVPVLLVVLGVAVATEFIRRNVSVESVNSFRGHRTRIETPLGSIGVDARDTLNPETAGIPVYPGAVRESRNSGEAVVDFESSKRSHSGFSIASASFTTADSASRVRDFYQARLPHWMFTSRRHGLADIELSKDGYKRIVTIDERGERTHIEIVAIGHGGVN